jgi:effector-binding domain-containing protein
MINMFKKLFYSVVIIIVIFGITGFFLPKLVHVERSIEIARPSSTVFTLVNSFATFEQWSPWAARDPSIETVITGPKNGVGARLEWQGDPRLSGSGTQEIILSTPWSEIQTRLNFEQQGEAITYFLIEDGEGSTRLTWGFDSDVTEGQNFFGALIGRYFGLLFDRWVGTDYEQGLSGLKTLAESIPNVDFSDLEVEILDVQPVDILYIQSGSSEDPGNIADAMASAYQEIMGFMNSNGIDITSQPMTITRAWNESGYAFDAAIPVDRVDVELTENVRAGSSPSGRAVRVVHRGAYDQMRPTYEKLSAYMLANSLQEGAVSWEQYISDPGQTDSEELLITHIYFLIEP